MRTSSEIAASRINIKSTMAIAAKINRISLPAQPNPLNLKENIRISLTSRKLLRGINAYKNVVFDTIVSNPDNSFCLMSNKPTKKSVFAGVFKPMKSEVCRVSRLNFAKR